MTRAKILAAAAVILSVFLIVEGANFLHATSDVRPSPPMVLLPVGEPVSDGPAAKKGDRLPVLGLPVSSTQPEAAPPVELPQQLQAATEDDLRQAEEEHHRRRDICRNGRTYFMRDGHQYWRCKR